MNTGSIDSLRRAALDRAVADVDVDGLMAQLEEPLWMLRRAIVAALAAIGDPAVRPLAASLQRDRKSETRIAATVDALVASTGDVEAVIVDSADHEDAAIVADVAQVLGRRRRAISVPTLVRLAEHKDDNVAVAALEGLGKVGGRAAVDAIVNAVESNQFFRTFPAIDVLGRTGDPRAVAPLAKLLASPQYAHEAARGLGRSAHRSAVVPLLALLVSPSDATVRVAALAVADLWQRHKETYGTTRPLDDALAVAVVDASADTAVRRLGHCLSGADVLEQVAICDTLGLFKGGDASQGLARLLDADPAVAAAAARALSRLGRTDGELATALTTGSSAQRAVLLPLLGRGRGPEIAACLQDSDASVRALACDALARLGHTSSVPELFERLSDNNPRVVQAAVGAIQSLGTQQTMALALAAASSKSAQVRRAALRVLSYFGRQESLTAFETALNDEDARVQETALQGLAFVEGARAFGLILDAATSPMARTRAAAMRALGSSRSDVRVQAALLRGLSDDDAWVRYYACQGVGKLALATSAAAVAALLDDPAGQVRVAAVEALSHLRSDAAHAALCAAAVSAEVDVKRAALIGLGIAGRNESLELLMKATTSEDAATRLVALSALAELTAPPVLPMLARAVSDADESVRTAALGFIASRPGADATRLLIGFLADENVREKARGALTVPVQGRVEGLLQALEGADDELAPQLTSVLARLNRADATAALEQAATLKTTAARKAAATTLAALGKRSSIDILKALAASDPEPEVRRVASLLLAQ